MPYSSSEESPTSAVPDVGRRQVGRVADGAPVVGASMATACAATSARAATLSSIPETKLSCRAFVLAVMADVVPGRTTMRYGVEVSWALPL